MVYVCIQLCLFINSVWIAEQLLLLIMFYPWLLDLQCLAAACTPAQPLSRRKAHCRLCCHRIHEDFWLFPLRTITSTQPSISPGYRTKQPSNAWLHSVAAAFLHHGKPPSMQLLHGTSQAPKSPLAMWHSWDEFFLLACKKFQAFRRQGSCI